MSLHFYGVLGRQVVDGYLGSLTTEERMLLHLFDHPLPEGEWEAPATLTQAGISAAVHVQRKHVPRTLKRLEKRGDLTTSKRHVPGAKQRRQVYGLTPSGYNLANDIREKILSHNVQVDGKKKLLSSISLDNFGTTPPVITAPCQQPIMNMLSTIRAVSYTHLTLPTKA